MDQTKLYTVEFNPKAYEADSFKCIHVTTLYNMLEINLGDFFNKGKLGNPNWHLIGVCESMEEGFAYAEGFLKRYAREAKQRKRGTK